MTTHFSSGVTNVKGKGLGTSLFSGIKQPLITGGTSPQEVAYQNDWVNYFPDEWDVVSAGASAYELVDYAGGWLRLGDGAPTAGEITGISGKEVWNYNANKLWYYETRISLTDVSEANYFVGFADTAFVDPATVPTDCIGFSHLEDTTTIQFLSRKNGAGVSFDMLEAGSTFAQLDSTVATQDATTFEMPSNSVRLGFMFQPVGSSHGVTAVQYQLFINGTVSGTQAATTVPDDIALEVKIFIENKGTAANDLNTDYIETVQQR
jgi:hypothetical protein